MTDETENSEDEFFDKVGEDTDPVTYFVKKLRECGSSVEKDGDNISVRDACENLHYHEAGDFKELFCDVCGISISVLSLIDMDNNEVVQASSNETNDADGDQELDELDEFLDAVNGPSPSSWGPSDQFFGKDGEDDDTDEDDVGY